MTDEQAAIDFALLDLLIERHPELDEQAVFGLYQQQQKQQHATIQLLTGQVTNQAEQLLDSAINQTLPKATSSRASYRIDSRLESGGQSDVFLARRDDGVFEQTVVIKRSLRPVEQLSARQQMRQEMQILADLKHPHVVNLLDAGMDEAQHPWMILEYIEGEHIDLYVQDQQLSQSAIITLAIQIAAALHHVHQQNICHLDIKPANVLVEVRQQLVRPVLIDFGIAMGPDWVASQPEALMATPAYAAPEQLNPDLGRPDKRSDIYAFGQLLQQLLNCQKPSTPSVLDADLQAIISHCCQPQKSHRYADMQAVVDDLRSFQNGQVVSVRPVGWAARYGKWARRHPTASVAAILVSLLVLAMLFYNHKQQQTANQRLLQLTASNQYYGRQAEAIRSDAALLFAKPTQNIERPYAALQRRYDQLLTAFAQEQEALDGLPLAKAALVLGRYESAQLHLQQALSREGENPQVLLLLAKNHFNLYKQYSDAVRQNAQAASQQLQLQALQEEWIEPAMDLLSRAQRQLPTADPVISSLLLYYSGQTQAALKPLSEAQQKNLWPVEQLLLSAQILSDEAQNKVFSGDQTAAVMHIENSVEMLKQAHQIARSDPWVLKQWCRTEGLSNAIAPDLTVEQAGGCAALLQLLPNTEEAIVLAAQTLALKARSTSDMGQDPLPAITAARHLFAAAGSHESAARLNTMGMLSAIEAQWLSVSDDNGAVVALQAIDYYRQAASQQPDNDQIQLNLADALYRFANLYYASHAQGDDFFNEAEHIYQQLTRHPQAHVILYADLVRMLTDHAYHRYQNSLQADQQLQQAERVFTQLNRRWSGNANTVIAGAYLFWTYAHYRFIQGHDPEPHFSQAVDYFQQDLARHAKQWTKRYNFVSLLLAGTMYRLEQGQEAEQLLAQIEQQLQALETQVSKDVGLDSHWGYYHNLQAMQAMISQTTPTAYLLKARQHNLRSVASPIDRYAGLTQLATTVLLMQQHQSAMVVSADLQTITAGLAEFPAHHRLRAQYGQWLLLKAEQDSQQQMALSQAALEQFDQALTQNPLLTGRYAVYQQRAKDLSVQ